MDTVRLKLPTNRSSKDDTHLVGRVGKQQKPSEGGYRELSLHGGGLGGALGFPLTEAGLLTTPALDLESLEHSSHRGLRSII